ncbi:hypothetical protein [Vibrio sp. TBV020]|uniref:hypothetical protein n=1 Tax=Vibrio sp. TBV020 TaxID=3137398 RepID=UPI0038CD3549
MTILGTTSAMPLHVKYQEEFDMHSVTWQLTIASIKADMVIDILWQGKKTQLHCCAQQVLSSLSTVISPYVFNALQKNIRLLIIQPICEQWFSLLGLSLPDVVDAKLQQECEFESQLTAKIILNENKEEKYVSWLFNVDSFDCLPFLPVLLKKWPEKPIMNYPKPPIKIKFISGMQLVSIKDFMSIHEGAVLLHGDFFYPNVALIDCTKPCIPTSITLLARSGTGQFQGKYNIDVPDIKEDYLLIVFEILTVSLSEDSFKSLIEDGVNDEALNHQLEGSKVNILVSCSENLFQFCGQGEVILIRDNVSVLITDWKYLVNGEMLID